MIEHYFYNIRPLWLIFEDLFLSVRSGHECLGSFYSFASVNDYNLFKIVKYVTEIQITAWHRFENCTQPSVTCGRSHRCLLLGQKQISSIIDWTTKNVLWKQPKTQNIQQSSRSADPKSADHAFHFLNTNWGLVIDPVPAKAKEGRLAWLSSVLSGSLPMRGLLWFDAL